MAASYYSRGMAADAMLRLFEAHREAGAASDIDAILATFVEDCFLETVPLGLRSEGKRAVRRAYEAQFFTAFPDLAPEDEGIAVGEDVIAVWGTLRGTSGGEWLGVPPSMERLVRGERKAPAAVRRRRLPRKLDVAAARSPSRTVSRTAGRATDRYVQHSREGGRS
jgi:hypothetical protein